MIRNPFDSSGYLYPRQLAAQFPHVDAYNDLAGRYLFAAPDGLISFTEAGEEKVIDRFKHLVFQCPVGASAATQFIDPGTIDHIGNHARDAYARQAGIHRLPNALLFGSDTVGPDLSRAFAPLIGNPSVRAAYLSKAGLGNEAYGQSGRNGWFESETDAALNQVGSQDFSAHMGVPGMSGMDVFFEMANGGYYLPCSAGLNTSMFEFYEPDRIRQISGTVYAVPGPEGLRKILLGFLHPFLLQGTKLTP
jgi:hypothetical protein